MVKDFFWRLMKKLIIDCNDGSTKSVNILKITKLYTSKTHMQIT